MLETAQRDVIWIQFLAAVKVEEQRLEVQKRTFGLGISASGAKTIRFRIGLKLRAREMKEGAHTDTRLVGLEGVHTRCLQDAHL